MKLNKRHVIKLMSANNVSVERLARAAMISTTDIYMALDNTCDSVSLMFAYRIANALNVDIAEILEANSIDVDELLNVLCSLLSCSHFYLAGKKVAFDTGKDAAEVLKEIDELRSSIVLLAVNVDGE